MKLVIYACGMYSLAFAFFHIGFWKIFKWKDDLRKLSFANKGIMQILNVQIVYYFILVAFLCFAFPNELLDTNLGKAFLLSCSLFWFIRTLQQFIFLKANHPKIHLLTFIFVLGTLLFALPLFVI